MIFLLLFSIYINFHDNKTQRIDWFSHYNYSQLEFLSQLLILSYLAYFVIIHY